MSKKLDVVFGVFTQFFSSVAADARFNFAEKLISRIASHVLSSKTKNPTYRISFLNELAFKLGCYTHVGGPLPLLQLDEALSLVNAGAAFVLSDAELGIYKLYTLGLEDVRGSLDWSAEGSDDETDCSEEVGADTVRYCGLNVAVGLSSLVKSGELKLEIVQQLDLGLPFLCIVKA